MNTEIITALIAAVPTLAIGLSTVYLNSQRKKDKEENRRRVERNFAKQSIINMVTQDIIRVQVLKQLPENHDNVEAEYDTYHSNGGNGSITRFVRDYELWLENVRVKSLDGVGKKVIQ